MQSSEVTCPTLEDVGDHLGPHPNCERSERTDFSAVDLKRIHKNEVHRAWVAKNKERRLAQLRAWYARTADLRREKFREWQHANQDKRREYKRQWSRSHHESVKRSNKQQYYKNREARRAYGKKYFLTNKERIKQRAAAWHKKTYPKNRHKLLAQTTLYAKSHPDIRRKCRNNWKANHPDKYAAHTRANNSRRRAICRGASADRRADRIIRLWRSHSNFVCFYCQNTFDILLLHVDHVLPISRGGDHSPGNICKSCPQCNLSKKCKIISQFVVRGQAFLL